MIDRNGIISTVIGVCNGLSCKGGYYGDGMPASNTLLNKPEGFAAQSNGEIYIADTGNRIIRKVSSNGIISTIAGTHLSGGVYTGDGGPAVYASLAKPSSIAVQKNGNVYFVEEGSYIRMVSSSTGIITTIAGTTNCAASSGLVSEVCLSNIGGLFVLDNGVLFFTDSNYVRRLERGYITNMAGECTGDMNQQCFALQYGGNYKVQYCCAPVSAPSGIALGSDVKVYYADTGNHIIRMFSGASTLVANHLLLAAVFVLFF